MEHRKHCLGFIAEFIESGASQGDDREFREHDRHAEVGPGLPQAGSSVGVLPQPGSKLSSRLDKMQDLPSILARQGRVYSSREYLQHGEHLHRPVDVGARVQPLEPDVVPVRARHR